eukprot:GEMP01005681.1.p1 GENE.GEMP01005681.1~~GEMP01005681.1.p1  ORF type:complete len:674 (+),score=171.49 GEMP01005681.1:763-2784(+)
MRLWFANAFDGDTNTQVRKGDGVTHAFAPIKDWYPEGTDATEPFTKEPTRTPPSLAIVGDFVQDERVVKVSCEEEVKTLPAAHNSTMGSHPPPPALCMQTQPLMESFTNDAIDWFYFDSTSTREVGPFTLEQMEAWFQWDQISETTDVRQRGMSCYVAFKDVLEQSTHAAPTSSITTSSAGDCEATSRDTLATTAAPTTCVDTLLPHGSQYFTDAPKQSEDPQRVPPGSPNNWLWSYLDDSNPSSHAPQGPCTTAEMLDKYLNGLLGKGDAFKEVLVKTDFMVSWVPAGDIFADVDNAFRSEPTRIMFQSWWKRSIERAARSTHTQDHATCAAANASLPTTTTTTEPNAHDQRRAARRQMLRQRDETFRKRFHIDLDATHAPRRKRQYDTNRGASHLRSATSTPPLRPAHSHDPPSSSITSTSSVMPHIDDASPIPASGSIRSMHKSLGDRYESFGVSPPTRAQGTNVHATRAPLPAARAPLGIPTTLQGRLRVPRSHNASFRSTSSSHDRSRTTAPLLQRGSIYGAPSSVSTESTRGTLFSGSPRDSMDRFNSARSNKSMDRFRSARMATPSTSLRSHLPSSLLAAKTQGDKPGGAPRGVGATKRSDVVVDNNPRSASRVRVGSHKPRQPGAVTPSANLSTNSHPGSTSGNNKERIASLSRGRTMPSSGTKK